MSLLQRRPGLAVAIVLLAVAGGLMAISWMASTGTAAAFIEGGALNLATELVGIALTVGLVDWVLEQRAERELTTAATPRVSELVLALEGVEAAHQSRLHSPSLDDLHRYGMSVRAASATAAELSVLLAARRPTSAVRLSAYARAAQAQLDRLAGLEADVQDAADGIDRATEEVRAEGSNLILLGRNLVALFADEAEDNPPTVERRT